MPGFLLPWKRFKSQFSRPGLIWRQIPRSMWESLCARALYFRANIAVFVKFIAGNMFFFTTVFFHPGFNLTKKLGKKYRPEGQWQFITLSPGNHRETMWQSLPDITWKLTIYQDLNINIFKQRNYDRSEFLNILIILNLVKSGSEYNNLKRHKCSGLKEYNLGGSLKKLLQVIAILKDVDCPSTCAKDIYDYWITTESSLTWCQNWKVQSKIKVFRFFRKLKTEKFCQIKLKNCKNNLFDILIFLY